MNVQEIFARRVKEVRTGRGWSQVKLAERLGKLGHPVDATVVTRTEKGDDRKVTLRDAVAFAAALGVPLHALLIVDERDAEFALTCKLKVRMPFAGSWLAGEMPLEAGMKDVEHYDDKGDLVWMVSAFKTALPDLLAGQPSDREVEMARAYAGLKHLQAERMERMARRPEAADLRGQLLSTASELHEDAAAVENRLPEITYEWKERKQ